MGMDGKQTITIVRFRVALVGYMTLVKLVFLCNVPFLSIHFSTHSKTILVALSDIFPNWIPLTVKSFVHKATSIFITRRLQYLG